MVAMLLVCLLALLLLSVPVAVAMAATCALVFSVFYAGTPMIQLLAQAMVTTSDSFPLMAIPFFMLVGTLMSRGGLAEEIINVGEAFTGRMAGGLGATTIVACMIFAAISGSGPAVVAALGVILIPAMVQRGYDAGYSGSLVAAGATIGPVIPPSIPMIIYSVIAGTSVVSMFAAGVFPGMLMGCCLLLVNYAICKKRGYKGRPRGQGAKSPLRECWTAKWALFLPVLILGGIYGGVFTPTEAAVVGSVYALLVGVFVYRQITLRKLFDACVEAGLLSCLSMFILGGATTFGRLLTMEQIPQKLAEAMVQFTSDPILTMALIMGFLLITGMFIDTTSNVVLFTPLFLPIMKSLGYSPVLFGVVMTMNLCLGMITPPVGVNLYVAQGISKTPFDRMIREAIPLMLALALAIAITIVFPQIALWFPDLLGLPY
ncbi:MAG: TRAP transporter large permease [Desulfovibrio sp.]|jgi:C4-dicarboxylate transporter DctM subunit|nr:TRAP transporter large permease [Desulfovibrio sp.]